VAEQTDSEFRRVVVDILGEVDVTADAETRHNLALQHLWNARHAARMCSECEAHLIANGNHEINHELRGHAMTAVISAAAFLESLVNEVFRDAVDKDAGRGAPRLNPLSNEAVGTMAELWKGADSIGMTAVLLKYQIALTSAGQPLLSSGAEPYQSAHLVKVLRDKVMHFKPEWQGDKEHSIEKQLRPKFPENQQVTAGPWYPNQALGANCAHWAWTSSVKFVDDWWQRMGLEKKKLNTALDGWDAP
jgi:hypothetical protein